MSNISRRDFVKLSVQGLLAFSGLLGFGGLIRFFSYKPDPPPPARFDIGLASDYPPDSRTVLPDVPALLIRNNAGFNAYSLVCTHLGCTVQAKADAFACPCHGSRYDAHGIVTKRPAGNPLQVLRVEVSPEGYLTIFKDRA